MQIDISSATGYSLEYINRIVNKKNPINVKFMHKFKEAFPDYDVSDSLASEPELNYQVKNIQFFDSDVLITISPP